MEKEKNDVSKSNRRNFMGKSAVMAAGAGVAGSAAAVAQPKAEKRVIHANGKKPEGTPLFSGMVAYGNLLFLSGVGYHKEGDIKVHTEKVLEQIKHNLEAAGSSMEKVLKASVFLADLKDYDAMNEVFRGKFGPEPPVRTTVSVSGVPGKSLVEIDVIAYI
jgi:enamine deaminase RidA (YjgF/YER057c/UK114 family)